MHPLLNDISSLSDADLQKKQNELMKKMYQSHAMGSRSLVNQIQMVLQEYTNEIQTRHRVALEAMMKKSGKGMDDIIDIN